MEIKSHLIIYIQKITLFDEIYLRIIFFRKDEKWLALGFSIFHLVSEYEEPLRNLCSTECAQKKIWMHTFW